MSYLVCPSCGLALFDRNPLTSPRHCARCARRGRTVELERVQRPGAGAAAGSVLGGVLGEDADAERRPRPGDV